MAGRRIARDNTSAITPGVWDFVRAAAALAGIDKLAPTIPFGQDVQEVR
jgi:hypothetical protein